MSVFKTAVKTILITGGLLFAAQQQAVANNQTVICSSRNNQYAYCRANTGNQVTMRRQISSSACQEGRTWGYDNNGIWVDKGCRAEFVVGAAYGDINNQNSSGAVPAWAVGNFQGTNLRDHTGSTIAISPTGEVIASWAGQTHTGRINGNIMNLGNLEFAVYQKGNGFQTTLRSDHSNQVLFRRIP